MSTFFFADPHFGHWNIVEYQRRPFQTTGKLSFKGIIRIASSENGEASFLLHFQPANEVSAETNRRREMKNPDDFSETPLDELLREASRVRSEQFGNEIEFCAIVNAKSGRCAMDCRFCAQSVHYETTTESYPILDTETLVFETRKQWNRGIHRVGWVTSGCSASDEEINQIVAAASRCHGGKLCASLGQLDDDSLRRLKESGVSRYHHNLETSEAFYPMVCGTQKWSDRLATVCRAKSLGLEVCCGGLFGLGESWKDRYELAMVLKELEVDSVPINFLSPISGTPFADRPKLSVEEGLRILAMYRILLPQTSIRICGGRPSTFGKRQPEILHAGINAIMTGDYLTTGGVSLENDLRMIEQRGFRPASGFQV